MTTATLTPNLTAVVWVESSHLANMVDAWAAQSFKAGTYDAERHACLADLVFAAGDLDEPIQTLLDDVAGRQALESLKERRQTVVFEALQIMGVPSVEASSLV